MKYSKILSITASALMILAACDKTKVPEYVPATPVADGEQVFFPGSVEDKYILQLEDVSFTIPIGRGSLTKEAMDVAIAASGEALDFFNIPGTVSFAEGAETADLVIAVKDASTMKVGKFYELSLAIADEELITPYGRDKVDIVAGFDFPWQKFDKGVMFDAVPWVGAELTGMEMNYQQISDNMRFCKVEKYVGDDDYFIDYTWYWNTDTDMCYVLPQHFAEYGDGVHDCTLSDEAGFYYYWKKKYEDFELASPEYFEWADYWMDPAKYYHPYYDGNGTFYLGDWFYITQLEDNMPTGRGWGFGGNPDIFKGASFGDYTFEVSYDGMEVNPQGEALPVLTFSTTKKSAKYVSEIKYVLTDQDTDPEETLNKIIAAEESGDFTGIESVTLVDGKITIKPAIDPERYRLVAVPYVNGSKDDKGNSTAVKDKFATYIDFYFAGMEGGAKEVEAYLIALSSIGAVGEEICEFYDYNKYTSFGFGIFGKDFKTAYLNVYASADIEGVSEEDLIEDIVTKGDPLSDEEIADINDGKGLMDVWGGLEPDTDYTIALVVNSIYDQSKLLTATYATVEYIYTGELVIGDYVIGGSNYIDLEPLPYRNTFVVGNLGVANNAYWYAYYDPDASTLTLDGYEYGYEAYGNQFGDLYGYADSAGTMAYGIFIYGEGTDGKDNLVFSVDPATKELTQINQQLAVPVYKLSDYSMVAVIANFPAGTAVEYVPAAAPAPVQPSYNKTLVEKVKTVKSKRAGQAKAFDQSLIQRNAAPSVSEPAKSKPISGWKHFDKSEAFNLNSLR